MIKFSVGDGYATFVPFEVDSIEDMATAILETAWSPGVFKDGRRNRDNFISSQIIALDIDSGMTLEEALEKFKTFKHVIGTTRNHRRDKHGLVADRFRVVLFTEEPLTGPEYEATTRSFISTYNTDPQCKDASRLFYACNTIVSVNNTGDYVKKVVSLPQSTQEPIEPLSLEQRGKLARSTIEFLAMGATPGTWNIVLYKAARDFHQNGYSEDEFIDRATRITGYLDNNDLTSIRSAFSKPPTHEPRLAELEEPLIVTSGELALGLMDYLSDKDLVKGQPTYLEDLDNLLAGKRLGEVTALCAEGKTGKNALWHYLQWLWLQNGVKFGYASRELDPDTEVLPDYLSMEFDSNVRLKPLTDDLVAQYKEKLNVWNIPFAGGRGHFPIDKLEEWVGAMKNMGIEYLFLDHLHWMCSDPEDYKEASNLSRMLKLFARKYQVHIDVIIQPKVLMEGQKPSLTSMKGGSAIGQNIDNFFTLERVPGQKYVSKLSLKAKRSRLAQTGEIYLQYDPQTLKFMEVGPSDQPEDTPQNIFPIGVEKQVF